MALMALLALLTLCATLLLTLSPAASRMPREVAAHLMVRMSDKPEPWRDAAALAARALVVVDRGARREQPLPTVSSSGARENHALDLKGALRVQTVDSIPALQDAVRRAEAGTFILLAAGHYRLEQSLRTPKAGRPDAPILLGASHLGGVQIEVAAPVGLEVVHPHWIFENLVFKGSCDRDTHCEHALHIKGNAHRTVVRNNRFEDFNAPLKVNREGGSQPDAGEVLRNSFINHHPRQTERSVTGIDLVAGSHWRLQGNLVSDFVVANPQRVTYALFAKGGATDTLIEGNVVLCEQRLRNLPGYRVGISLGGGETSPEHCRDGRRCDRGEHVGGHIRNNLVVGCSDAGIHLNRANRAVVAHNTLIDTAGLQARQPETLAFLWANWMDAPAREERGAQIMDDGQAVQRPAWQAYLGWSRANQVFVDPAALDLRWRDRPQAVQSGTSTPKEDLCGVVRPSDRSTPGAFENWESCHAQEVTRLTSQRSINPR